MTVEYLQNEHDIHSFKVDYPHIKLEFNINDIIMIRKDAIPIYKNSHYDYGEPTIKVIVDNSLKKLQIIDICVVIEDDGIIKKYYKLTDNKTSKFFLPEPCLSLIKRTINYNEPRKLVYEKLTFDDFLLEGLDEIHFIMSDELIDIITEIEHPISVRLLKDSENSKKYQITLLDIDEDSNNMWCFVNSIKAIQYIIDKGENPERSIQLMKNKKEIFNTHKSKSRIGRIIKKLYGDDFDTLEIESFVNEYKKMFIVDFDLIDNVKGLDINYWYHKDNYEWKYDSPLCNSCMAGDTQNEYIDFYSVNDKKVSLVIMYEDIQKNKIKARALLWKPDKVNGSDVNGVYFMDRVYFNSESDKNSMIKYAENNGWYHKLKQNSVPDEYIYNPNTKEYESITFTINDLEYPDNHLFPYVDTLKYLNIKNNYITNDNNGSGYYTLYETDGSINGIVWSKTYNKFLGNNGVVYAHIDNNRFNNDYLYRTDCVFLDLYNEWYSKEYIKKSDMIEVEKIGTGRKESIFKSDAIYSNTFKKYYWRQDVRFVNNYGDNLPYNELVRCAHLGIYLLKDDAILVVVDDYNNYGKDISSLDEYNISDFEFMYDYFPKGRTDLYFEYLNIYFGIEYKKILNLK